jgi:hypothetical protein
MHVRFLYFNRGLFVQLTLMLVYPGTINQQILSCSWVGIPLPAVCLVCVVRATGVKRLCVEVGSALYKTSLARVKASCAKPNDRPETAEGPFRAS